MYYAVTHLTEYVYTQPITDSVMELRMQPRNDEKQRNVRFRLDISPQTKILDHRDYLGNILHTFDVPARHTHLAIKAESIVEVRPPGEVPDSLPMDTWHEIDARCDDREFYDMLLPGKYAHETAALMDFAQEIDWRRRDDPLSLLRELTAAIYVRFEYRQFVTSYDSTIDVALEARRGVCQDFTHVMLALVRHIGIPCRYVSGYLYHHNSTEDRSAADASHAWMEAWLPDLGWVGFDPTNNLVVEDRHIRVSVANDYAGASPSRGVFKGAADTRLSVQVQVSQLDELPADDAPLAPDIVMPHHEYLHQQQNSDAQRLQQQQQQQ